MKTDSRTWMIKTAMTIITAGMIVSLNGISAEASSGRRPAQPTIVITNDMNETMQPAAMRNTVKAGESVLSAQSAQEEATEQTIVFMPAPEAANVFSYEENSLEEQILRIQNEYRAQAGLHALAPAQGLTAAAWIRADEMAATGFFSHTRPDGSFCFTASADIYGENLYRGAQEVANAGRIVEMLYASPAHYENMMDAGFTTCGIAIAQGTDGMLYCAIEYGF